MRDWSRKSLEVFLSAYRCGLVRELQEVQGTEVARLDQGIVSMLLTRASGEIDSLDSLSINSTARCTMSFADLFARYREMGAMGPQHGLLFNEVENVWTYSIDDDSQDAADADGDGKQERTTLKPSRAFSLTSEGDHIRVSSYEEFEELVTSPHRLRLNLDLLKNDNVCKEYYRLTSNVLRSLVVGIKEITTDEITPAWQIGFPCPSPKKRFSSLFVDKLNEDATYPRLTSIHTTGEVGISKLSSFSCSTNSKLPTTREIVNIVYLRRWLWDQIGHPVSYMPSTSPVNEDYRTDAVIEKEQTTSEAQLVSEEISCEGPEQMTSSEPVDRIPQVENTEESATLPPTTKSESADTTTSDETPTQSNSSRTPLASTPEDDEALTKPSTDSESDHEPLVRRIRPINQTASGNKQFTPSLRVGDDEEKPRKHIEVNSLLYRKNSVPVGCKPREVERQIFSSKKPRQTTVVARNNETIMPPRSKSWCLAGGYVKRFAANQQASRKIQPPSKNQP